ncbi:hypothetical protein ACTXM3_18020 [Glutamicibacter arilaitensis]|uniref:hypothetical protein n=2 Tax=Bacteria TaxID=2 RepID=UPI0011AF1CE0|nr:hypothetical protein [Glutamicibacter arilaitensis]
MPKGIPTQLKRSCATCGKEFTAASNRQIYCGKDCKNAARRVPPKRPATVPATPKVTPLPQSPSPFSCPVCGQHLGIGGNKFCSAKCSNVARQRRYRAKHQKTAVAVVPEALHEAQRAEILRLHEQLEEANNHVNNERLRADEWKERFQSVRKAQDETGARMTEQREEQRRQYAKAHEAIARFQGAIERHRIDPEPSEAAQAIVEQLTPLSEALERAVDVKASIARTRGIIEHHKKQAVWWRGRWEELAETDLAQQALQLREQLEQREIDLRAARNNLDKLAEINRVLKGRLDIAAPAHKKLRKQYQELGETHREAMKRQKELVLQWNTLCLQLYRRTAGRPQDKEQKKILNTWLQWREAMKQRKDATNPRHV